MYISCKEEKKWLRLVSVRSLGCRKNYVVEKNYKLHSVPIDKNDSKDFYRFIPFLTFIRRTRVDPLDALLGAHRGGAISSHSILIDKNDSKNFFTEHSLLTDAV